MTMKRINLIDLLYILELEPSCIEFTKMDYQQALAGVDGFKELIKKQRKRLAIKHHPDRNGGDDTLMKEVNNAADLLLTLEIKPIQKPQLRPMRMNVYGWGKSSSEPTGGTTTSGTWFS